MIYARPNSGPFRFEIFGNSFNIDSSGKLPNMGNSHITDWSYEVIVWTGLIFQLGSFPVWKDLQGPESRDRNKTEVFKIL